MPTTLRNPKAKSKAKIYEHTENIYPKGHEESVATKEFVRQEFAPVKESVNRLWQVTLGGFALLLTVMIYLHSDTKANMKELKTELKADMKEINKRLDKIGNLLQKR